MAAVLLGAGLGRSAPAAEADSAGYAAFLEPGFPFLESTVDARHWGDGFPAGNLTPRAVVLDLGGGTFAAFDTDLLRLAAAWHGGVLEPRSIAMLSYHEARRKMGPGSDDVARPIGRAIAATGIHAGWHPGTVNLGDPRPPGPDPAEVGRGPLDPAHGRWEGVELVGSGAHLHYRIAGTVDVTESLTSLAGQAATADRSPRPPAVVRSIRMTGTWTRPLSLIVAELGGAAWEMADPGTAIARPAPGSGPDAPVTVVALVPGATEREEARTAKPLRLRIHDGAAAVVECPPTPSAAGGRLFAVSLWRGPANAVNAFLASTRGLDPAGAFRDPAAPLPRWPEVVETRGALAPDGSAYVVDRIPLPDPNPWRRNVRPSGIDFLPDGRAAVVTYDGDVYLVDGLRGKLESVAWRRIAAGFNEPQSIRVREGELFVFSRGGITRLVDRNGDGEIDAYENFCNAFAQSADTRDYAHSLAVTRDGRFLASKGGQQDTHLSPHAGRVLEISPDGLGVEVFATGLRNGYVAVHPETGLVTASDQQGHWIPTTPVHVVRRGDYLGFRRAAPGGPEASEPPVRRPVALVPHRVAQSAVGQVWLTDERMGPLEGSLLVLDYFRPGLVRVFLDGTGAARQAAVAPLPVPFRFPLLKAAMNPADGSPYLVGFQVWGSAAEEIAGFGRLRFTGTPDPTPVDAALFHEGLLVRFADPVDPAVARDPATIGVQSWAYRRSASYGSGHYRSDGSAGTDPRAIHDVFLSQDRRSVFVAAAGIPSGGTQVELRYAFPPGTRDDGDRRGAVYFTSHDPPSFDPAGHGFPPIDFATLFAGPARVARASAGSEEGSRPAADRGATLYETIGCIACHSIDGSTDGKTGPSWLGLHGSRRTLTDGTVVVADDDHIRQSILEPSVRVAVGFDPKDVGMPSYAGILGDADIESIVLFIRSLAAPPARGGDAAEAR